MEYKVRQDRNTHELTSWSKLRNLRGNARIVDGARVMPKTLCGDSSTAIKIQLALLHSFCLELGNSRIHASFGESCVT